MERVRGIGGVFFRAGDAPALRAWYAEHLGIAVEDYGGALFTAREGTGRSGRRSPRTPSTSAGSTSRR